MHSIQVNREMTKGIWSSGKNHGEVIAPMPEQISVEDAGHYDSAYYGGYLIAESIRTEADKQAIMSSVNGTYGKGLNPDEYENIHTWLSKIVKQGFASPGDIAVGHSLIDKAKF